MKLILSNDQSQTIQIDNALHILTFKEKLQQSIKKFSLFIGLTIGSIFIPVFHFVLVPTFILATIYMTYKTLKLNYKITLSANSNCLKCHRPLQTVYLLDNDLRIKCPNCFETYLLTEC